MKFSQQLAAVAALAGIANAQSQCLTLAESIPACALGYIASFAYYSDNCGLVDFACQCSHTQDIEVGVAASLPSGCNAGDVLNSASQLCACASSNAGSSVSLNAIESSCQASAAAIPPCALGYLAEGAFSVAQCQLNDFECQCSNSASIAGAIEGSVSSACGASGFQPVLDSVSALCSCVSGGGGGGSGSPSATPTGSSSGSASATGSASPSGTSKSGPSATGSSKTSATGVGSSGGSKSSSPTAGTTGGSKGGSGSGSGSMAIPTFTGAGATATAFGGLFGIVAGLAAFL